METRYLSCGLFLTLLIFVGVSNCDAQLTTPRTTNSSEGGTATLEELLINQLRATTDDRKAYVRLVVQLVDNGQFERSHVVAIERWARRRNPQFPFPYFERAMRYEAGKRDIVLPPVQLLAGVASSYVP